jgi:hypothetical protein
MDYLSLVRSTIILDILKIRRIKIAQKEATIPINAIALSPSKRWLKSSNVMLKIIKAKAKTTNIEVKIFIFVFLIEVKLIKIILDKQIFNISGK